MGSFDDANVDKDLLNQIFADEGEDMETDALLDEMLKAVEETSEDASKEETNEIEEAQEVEMTEDMQVMNEIPAVEEEVPVTEEVSEVEETPVVEDAPATEGIPVAEEAPVTDEATVLSQTFSAEGVDASVNVLREAECAMDEERANGTVTVITKGTTINGGISSDGSLEVMGVITGDVECQGKVSIVGSVSGNVIASQIFVNTERLEGSLSSEGPVKVGEGTVIIGDVDATSAYIAGAVKGDIDVNGHVIIDSTAVVKGNIKAKSIQVNSGAVVDGYCSLNYAGVDLDNFFGDAEAK